MGHNYMDHDYMNHNCIGHNYTGHNYIDLQHAAQTLLDYEELGGNVALLDDHLRVL